MTEESYQQCRKVMRQINHLRGLITKAKKDIAKWTHIDGACLKELQQGQADGAHKCIQKAMKKLEELKLKFDLIKFPDSNIIIAPTEKTYGFKTFTTESYHFQFENYKQNFGMIIPTSPTPIKKYPKYFGWNCISMKKWVGIRYYKRIVPVRADRIFDFLFWKFVKPIKPKPGTFETITYITNRTKHE